MVFFSSRSVAISTGLLNHISMNIAPKAGKREGKEKKKKEEKEKEEEKKEEIL